MKYRIKKLAVIGVSTLLIGSQVISVSADTADDIAYLEQQQAATNAELEAVQNTINDLESQKNSLLAQIDEYDAQLVSVITTINLLDNQIKDKEKELEQTAKDLKLAEQKRDAEYEAMKERIRYLYEEGGNAGWATLLLSEDDGLSNIIDKADYTQKLYDYDRKELDAYTESVERVDALQEQQTAQKATLETMKREQEQGKEYLEELLAEAEEASEITDARLSEAGELAAQYVALIEEQNAAISELYARQEEERRAAEAAAAAAAAAEAERAAAAQRAAAAAAAASYSDSSSNSDGTSYDGGYSEGSSEVYVEDAPDAGYVEEYSAPAVGANGVSGSDVVNHALQYVGNAYVWGGTNPSSGADCSGFVQAIYRELGYDISRTSYTQLNDGVSVSYADAQPGDIINYGHHVAIYMGDGQIVHAANEQLGITTSTNATYQPIVDVRRIIN